MYFHTDNTSDIEVLAFALSVAHQQEKRVRFNIDANGSLIYKIGEGIWSVPFKSTVDPYRDVAMYDEMAVDAENVKVGDRLTAFDNVRVTSVTSHSEFKTEICFANGRDFDNGYIVLPDIATVTVRRPL